MSKVSIIMNCYNGEEFLAETLKTVSMQVYENYEIIFVDNCSTDNSGEIAKRFGEKLKYYKTDYNIPLGEARNFGLARCTGEYIAFLDSDDLWDSEMLKEQVNIMEKNPDVAISITNNYVLNMMMNKKYVVIDDLKEGTLSYEEFAIKYKFGLSSFMIRRRIVDEMKLSFDVRMSYTEEFDLFLRLACYGKVFFLNKPLSTYRLHPQMHSLKLKDSIPGEYDMVIHNLINCNPSFPEKHPSVIQRVSFLRDYTKTKLFVENKEYKEARKTIRPYINNNKRAAFFYFITYLPAVMIDKIYNSFFRKKTL